VTTGEPAIRSKKNIQCKNCPMWLVSVGKINAVAASGRECEQLQILIRGRRKEYFFSGIA